MTETIDSISLDTIFLSSAPNELDEAGGENLCVLEPNENDVLLGRGKSDMSTLCGNYNKTFVARAENVFHSLVLIPIVFL